MTENMEKGKFEEGVTGKRESGYISTAK